MGQQALIELEHAGRTYAHGGGAVHALRDINLQMCAAQSWAILGTSGSGKSTLLNILGCLDRLDSGEYKLAGTDITHMHDDALSEVRLRTFGFIFQSFNLLAQLNVLENIELPLFYLHMEAQRARRRAQELAHMVGLYERRSHRPAELSGGQQQRVAIARALANDPAVILADEPTGNLDTGTSAQIMELLMQQIDLGKTLVMVTHDHALGQACSHRIELRDGAIVGEPDV
ncbi:MAG: ABC transporter ATP-binding protein [Desulfuromonadaceae bacterium]